MKNLIYLLLLGVVVGFSGCCEECPECPEQVTEATETFTKQTFPEGDISYNAIITGFAGEPLTRLKSQGGYNWGCAQFPDHHERDWERPYFDTAYAKDTNFLHFAVLNNFKIDTLLVTQMDLYGDAMRIDGKKGEYPDDFYVFVNCKVEPGVPKTPITDPNPPNGSKPGGGNDIMRTPIIEVLKMPADLDESYKNCLSDMNNKIPVILPVDYDGDEAFYHHKNKPKGVEIEFSIVFFEGTPDSVERCYAAAVHID